MTTQGEPSRGLVAPRGAGDIRIIGAVAGIIGPVLFTFGFVVQGWFRRGEYDPIAETVSALEAGPQGWIQQLNFLVFGILMMIFSVGLGIGLTPLRWLGSGMVAWWGVGLVMAGLFPLRQDLDGQTYDPTGMHQPNGAVFFLSTWVGLAILTWCLRSDARWRGLARYTLIATVALAGLFITMGVFAIPSDAPLHPWAGLLQRAVLAVWFPCLIALAIRLWHVSRSQSLIPIGDQSISIS
jgi:hypothetical membrane protein